MQKKDLHQLLIEAARKLPEDEKVPYSFEKRIMAQIQSIQSRNQVDDLALWARGLWQAAIPCLALMIALGTWNAVDQSQAQEVNPLAVDLELTMLQPFDELSVEELW